MELFDTSIHSNYLIILTVFYFILASITTFDMRINQAILQGEELIPLPPWTGIFAWLMWITWIIILILNWKFALFLFVLKFLLKVIPVFEIVGKILMQPFNPNTKIHE